MGELSSFRHNSAAIKGQHLHMRRLILSIAACGILLTTSQPAWADAVADALVDAAIARTKEDVRYDPAYRSIPYPNGDVAPDRGVCTDVIIRSYRQVGVDLQQRVHEDMKAEFNEYPDNWGLRTTDRNIDHRRVPNLQTYLERQDANLPVSDKATDYKPGDLVTWSVGNRPHIGIVTDKQTRSGTPKIVHNIGGGPQLEDMLFDYPITGHYRWLDEVE